MQVIVSVDFKNLCLRDTYFFAFVSSAGVFLKCITASAKFGSFIKKGKQALPTVFHGRLFSNTFLKCNKRLKILLMGIYLKFYW